MTATPTISVKARSWGFFARWTAAFIGFPIGGLAAIALVGKVESAFDGLMGGLAAGTVIGCFQWIAARKARAVNEQWVVAMALGLGIGNAVSIGMLGAETDATALTQRAILTGAILGLAQWIALRRQYPYILWWIIFIPLLYTVAWTITRVVIGESVNDGFIVFGASGALVFQLVSGLGFTEIIRLQPVE